MQAAVLLIVAVAILGEENPAAAALNRNHEAFKQKMMPLVGKEVTVRGVLSVGKVSEFIYTDDPGAVYVKLLKTEDIKKSNELSRMVGKRLAVTGKLRFREDIPSPSPDIAAIREHFFIDIGEAAIRTIGQDR